MRNSEFLPKKPKTHQFFDEEGITAQGIVVYAKAMLNNSVDDLPEELYEKVQSNPKWLYLITRQYSLLSEKSKQKRLEQANVQAGPFIAYGKRLTIPEKAKIMDYCSRKLNSLFRPNDLLERLLSFPLMNVTSIRNKPQKLQLVAPEKDEFCIGQVCFNVKIPEIFFDNPMLIIRNNQNEVVEKYEVDEQWQTDANSNCRILLDLPRERYKTGLYYFTISVGDDGNSVTNRFKYCTLDDAMEIIGRPLA